MFYSNILYAVLDQFPSSQSLSHLRVKGSLNLYFFNKKMFTLYLIESQETDFCYFLGNSCTTAWLTDFT